MHFLKSLVLAILVMLAVPSFAQTTITQTADGYDIAGGTYKASVAKDGCLTNIKINDQEFLSLVSISRGTYFFQSGITLCPTVSQLSPDTILAVGDKSEISYTFASDKMTWTLKNKTAQDMQFFTIIDASVKVMCDDSGMYQKTAVSQNSQKNSWFKSGSKLSLDNGFSLWGPWESDAQVWQANLAPNETKSITVTMGKTTPDEDKKIQDAMIDKVEKTEGVEVYSPKEYQVFQRSSKYIGSARLSGKIIGKCDTLEYRITGKALKGIIPTKWHNIQFAKPTGAYSTTISLPAGGWYKLELRSLIARKSVDTAVVEHFGIGEVFIGAGQSNSTNYGEEKTSTATKMVSSFSGTEWKLAEDPQLGAHDNSTGGSFWPTFGDALYAKLKVPIGVAVTGHGGTSVTQWSTNGDLFQWLQYRIQALGVGGFRAVMWHQGETDVSMTTKTYFKKMKTLIEDSNRKAGWHFPWFVAQVSYLNPTSSHFDSTRNAQKKLWDDGVALQGPDTDAMGDKNRDGAGAGIHFSLFGLITHGKAWAELVGDYIDKTVN